MNLLIDTDVLICFLRGDERVRPIFALQDRFYFSYITKKELLRKPGLLSGPLFRRQSERTFDRPRSTTSPQGVVQTTDLLVSRTERERVSALLNRMRQVPVNGPVATLAESLLKRYRTKGLQAADALIAATAMTLKALLVTFNRRHFENIEGLRLFPAVALPIRKR